MDDQSKTRRRNKDRDAGRDVRQDAIEEVEHSLPNSSRYRYREEDKLSLLVERILPNAESVSLALVDGGSLSASGPV